MIKQGKGCKVLRSMPGTWEVPALLLLSFHKSSCYCWYPAIVTVESTFPEPRTVGHQGSW